METMLKANTTIVKSDNPIDVDGAFDKTETTLAQIDECANYDNVTVQCKVIVKKQVMCVPIGKKKREVLVADSTGTGRVILWEEHVDDVDEQRSYLLKNFVIREYMSVKYLEMGKDVGEIEEIADIGEVDTKSDMLKEEVLQVWKNAVVIAVPKLDVYKACLVCKARVEPSIPPFEQCSKCAIQQRIDFCKEQTTAKLLIMANSKMMTLSAFGKMVFEIAGVNEDT